VNLSEIKIKKNLNRKIWSQSYLHAASSIKIYNTASSLARFENKKKYFLLPQKTF
jgi:ribosomal protein L31E